MSLPPDCRIENVDFSASTAVELGRGSDATVYKGAWYGALVAIKVFNNNRIRGSQSVRAEFLPRFSAEYERMRHLRHPNIVQFLGVFITCNDLPALVTELMDSTLQERYEAEPPLTRLEELKFLGQTVAGLRYLHSQGVIHRDLKTANVLITSDGRAKLSDMGVARCLHGDNPLNVLGSSGLTQAPGTLLYMSPEALKEKAVYDEKLDCFSFGVLMLALLVRSEPNPRILCNRSFTKVGQEMVPQQSEVDLRSADLDKLRLPEEHPLLGLIIKCLQLDPESRPSASDLYIAIEQQRECVRLADATSAKGDLSQRLDEMETHLRKTIAQNKKFEKTVESLQRQADESFAETQQLLADNERLNSIALQVERHLIHNLGRRKWKTLSSPFPAVVSGPCLSLVHKGLLYVTARVGDSWKLFFTENLKRWNSAPLPEFFWCFNLISDGDRMILFCQMSAPDTSQCCLYRSSSQGDAVQVSSWDKLEKSNCRRRHASCFIISNNVVLVGGVDIAGKKMSSVSVYSLMANDWIRSDDWPHLPSPTASQMAIVTPTQLHLIGGNDERDNVITRATTISLIRMQPHGGWRTAIVPALMIGQAGVTLVNQFTFVAVGGHSRQLHRSFQDVFVLDVQRSEWVRIASLSTARISPALACYREKLIVVGGSTAGKFLGTMEELDIALLLS